MGEYEEKVKKIRNVFSYPFVLAAKEVFVTVSIGIAFAPKDGKTTQTILKNLDSALFQAKSKGKNNYCYYEEEMNERYGRCVIDIIHVGRVSTGQYHTYLNFLRKLFLSYQSLLLSCLLKGLGISVLGYLSSYFFQWIIDEIKEEIKKYLITNDNQYIMT